MKAVTSPVIITGVATRSDGSLSLRVSTPELKPDEKLVFLELQGQELKALFQPQTDNPEELKEVKGQFDNKTPSVRCRGVLFVAWKHGIDIRDSEEFESFYKRQMESFIDSWKAKLPE